MHPVDEPIEVVAARSEWLEEGQALRHDLCAALGVATATVEHIGSTSVPGLAAKPVIDLMVGCVETERRAVAEQIAAERTGWLLAYSTAKADTVVALLERARQWARTQGHDRS